MLYSFLLTEGKMQVTKYYLTDNTSYTARFRWSDEQHDDWVARQRNFSFKRISSLHAAKLLDSGWWNPKIDYKVFETAFPECFMLVPILQ